MLTIVVPTVPGRESLLSRCLWSITSQPGVCRVLVVDGDGRLGDKVNAAAAAVDTPYMTVVDDDDYLDGSYLDSTIHLLDGTIDYVGFKFLELCDGEFHAIATSRAGDPWSGNRRGTVPKGITRTSIVRQVSFGNSYTADRAWSAAVADLVRRDVFVSRVLYVHDWRPGHSTFTGAQHRHVGDWPVDEDRIERLTVAR